MAHRALLLPLAERGLEPGDDAVLFVLGRAGTTEFDLADELGLPRDAVATRINRLTDRELIIRQAVGPELAPGVALTERGRRIRNGLADHWTQLEEALMDELKPKQRKKLGDTLKRFVELLRL